MLGIDILDILWLKFDEIKLVKPSFENDSLALADLEKNRREE